MSNMDEILRTAEEEAMRTMQEDNGQAYDIIVKNQQTGEKTYCLVYGANTINQVLVANAEEIGLNQDAKEIFFVNERTNQSTTNKEMTIREFDLRENDTLSVLCDGKVA